MTIAEVASRSGVHETSIYRQWKTKEMLLVEALLERVGVELPIPDTGTIRSDLIELLREVTVFLHAPISQEN